MRFDPDMFEHPKFEQYADRPTLWANAVALFMRACSYATRQRDLHPQRVELHGFVPRSVLSRLVPFRGAEGVAEALCIAPSSFEHGLFERAEGGYRIHDFADFAPPDREVQPDVDPTYRASKPSSAERTRAWRDRKRHTSPSPVTESSVTCDASPSVTGRHGDAPLPHTPSPRDLDLGLETREARVTRDAGRDGSRDDARDAGRDVLGRTANGRRADALRDGYRGRFERAHPGVAPDPRAQATGTGGPWLELAREMRDEDVDRFLDAFFADAWCSGEAALKLGALVSERVRLLTKGPTLAKGGARRVEPASHEDFRERVEREAGKGATHVRRDF